MSERRVAEARAFMSFYALLGIGILVEVARRLGMGFSAARAELKEAQPAGEHETGS